jgi:nucleotide-binding universal stress UspA family protein
MSYRKFLAPLTGGTRDAAVLASAFAAAKPFDGHVVALFVRPDPAEAMPFFGEGVSGTMVQEIVDVARAAADKAAADAKAVLSLAANLAHVTLVEHPERRDGASASFRETQGNFADQVTQAALLSDVIVFGPLKEGERPSLTEAFEATLLETGRPVLLSAHAPSRDFARRVAVAWDGGAASAHALIAAMPYLARADGIDLLMVQPGAADDFQDVKDYLALHGISCSVRKIEAGSRAVGEVLLETASQGGAGLLVLGGYRRNRIRQLFVGGVTKHVVSHAEIPLFLVH